MRFFHEFAGALGLAACAASAASACAAPDLPGAPETRASGQAIVGGDIVACDEQAPNSPSEARAVGQLRFDGDCTATLVRPNVLITAAHCVLSPWSGTSWRLNRADEELPGAPVFILDPKGYCHPPSVHEVQRFIDLQSDQANNSHEWGRQDIALVRLRTSAAAAPVPLAAARPAPAAGLDVRVYGLGLSAPDMVVPDGHLRRMQVPYGPLGSHNDGFLPDGNIRRGALQAQGPLSPRVSFGDSGGPGGLAGSGFDVSLIVSGTSGYDNEIYADPVWMSGVLAAAPLGIPGGLDGLIDALAAAETPAQLDALESTLRSIAAARDKDGGAKTQCRCAPTAALPGAPHVEETYCGASHCGPDFLEHECTPSGWQPTSTTCGYTCPGRDDFTFCHEPASGVPGLEVCDLWNATIRCDPPTSPEQGKIGQWTVLAWGGCMESKGLSCPEAGDEFYSCGAAQDACSRTVVGTPLSFYCNGNGYGLNRGMWRQCVRGAWGPAWNDRPDLGPCAPSCDSGDPNGYTCPPLDTPCGYPVSGDPQSFACNVYQDVYQCVRGPGGAGQWELRWIGGCSGESPDQACPAPGCDCTGTDHTGSPVHSTTCGETVCGVDYQEYSCSPSGWAPTGDTCSIGEDTFFACAWGADACGEPVIGAPRQLVCGGDLQVYQCVPHAGMPGGGTWITRPDFGPCQMMCDSAGTPYGCPPLDAACGVTVHGVPQGFACGSDQRVYQCRRAPGAPDSGYWDLVWEGDCSAALGESCEQGCDCYGAGVDGQPVHVTECAQTVCGADHAVYQCRPDGWHYLGGSCDE